MRRSLIEIAIIVATGLLALFLILSPSLWSRRREPQAALPPQIPAKTINNPYTEWSLAWQNDKHSHTLVVARTKSEDVSWLDDELVAGIQKAVYVVDDDSARLRVPANKGNEAMVYLSYMIDFYDKLPDVSTFMHSHEAAWHNNELFNRSSRSILSRLSLEKVVREGYVNLRCDLEPGCPVSAQLDRLNDGDSMSRMSKIMADALLDLFPGQAIPPTLAQACCAQFSLSRESIRQHPKQYYKHLRDWLIKSDYPNVVSGRVFEYAWHYLFIGKPIFCPSEHICYCDAYRICFPSSEAWDQYMSIIKAMKALEGEHGKLSEAEDQVRRRQLEALLESLRSEAEKRRIEAFSLGSDIINRQKILHDAWELLKTRGQT